MGNDGTRGGQGAETRFRELLDIISEWVWEIDENGHYTFCSARVLDLLGYKPEEVLGKTPADFMSPQEAERIGPIFDELLASREPFSSQANVLTHRDGHEVHVQTDGVPIFDADGAFEGYRGVDRDVTDNQRVERALRECEERYRALVEFSPYAITVSHDGKFVYLNPAAVAMGGGKSADEFLGMPFLSVIHPESLKEAKAFLELSDATDRIFYIDEMKLIRADGSIVSVETAARFVTYEGKPSLLTLVRDISERKFAEQQQRALEKRLEVQKRNFYRETILSVTDGKLDMCEQSEIKPYVAGSAVRMDVRDASAVSVARHEIATYCLEHGASPSRLDAFMIGVGEAITNALKHAKWGRVYAGADDGTAWVAVADRGGGISSLILPKATLLRGYSTKPSLGLGYTIMLEVSDRILLKTGERGTTVVLVHELCEPGREVKPDQIKDTWQTIAT